MTLHLLRRPIAVSMFLIAIIVLGGLAIRYLPVSLMPNIDVPQITVHLSSPGSSASEVEQRLTKPFREQLTQVDGVKDIRSESRADAGSVLLTFEPGTDMNMVFIEVNEKIDRAMSSMPEGIERPRVVRAGAMDIPAFYLDMWLAVDDERNATRFAELGRFARGVVSKRIEQLPQTAMVDISGTTGTEIVCIPNEQLMTSLGLSARDVENVILQNNITLRALSVVDGIFRYHIHFDSQLLTREDIANIYFRHDDRLLQLRDICSISERMMEPNGIVRHNGARAITMAIIKQNDARMDDLQEGMNAMIDDLRKEFPDVRFELTRDQTALLSYTISNLKQNLLIGALLASLILFLFMKQWRLSLLVVLSIPLSLILTLLGFYCLGISLNIISLSGLILGVGMIVDNSIIVIDNISRRRHGGEPLAEAVVGGTREVFAPMLSSVLTTCSVFLPLIFLSGTAGALFYDESMGVTLSLFASLAVAAIVLPVYYFVFYRNRKQIESIDTQSNKRVTCSLNPLSFYERGLGFVLRHSKLCLSLFALCIPLAVLIFYSIDKQRMPDIPEHDALLSIDWNAGVSPMENDKRVKHILSSCADSSFTFTSMCGTQDFLLPHTRDITSSEAVVYVDAPSTEDLEMLIDRVKSLLFSQFPEATLEVEPAGNIYSLMFSTDEADLEIHLQDVDGRRPSIADSKQIISDLQQRFPEAGIMPVVTETDVRLVVDMEKMAVQRVSYDILLQRLRAVANRNRVMEINDGAQSVPVIIGNSRDDTQQMLKSSVTNADGTQVPISLLVTQSQGEHYKRLPASAAGEFYNIMINADNDCIEDIIHYTDSLSHSLQSTFSASFAGGYFSSRQLVAELSIVLAVALVLLYLILAAQFENLLQPLIILSEMVVDVFFVVLILWACGMSLNLMSMIGLVVVSGIVINDSILKVDTINRLYRSGVPLLKAVLIGGHRRLRPIVMTSLTTILAIIPCLWQSDMGSALQRPLSVTLIVGLSVGTLVSLFIIPLLYVGLQRVFLQFNRKEAI